jgi:hypothetical protein
LGKEEEREEEKEEDGEEGRHVARGEVRGGGEVKGEGGGWMQKPSSCGGRSHEAELERYFKWEEEE